MLPIGVRCTARVGVMMRVCNALSYLRTNITYAVACCMQMRRAWNDPSICSSSHIAQTSLRMSTLLIRDARAKKHAQVKETACVQGPRSRNEMYVLYPSLRSTGSAAALCTTRGRLSRGPNKLDLIISFYPDADAGKSPPYLKGLGILTIRTPLKPLNGRGLNAQALKTSPDPTKDSRTLKYIPEPEIQLRKLRNGFNRGSWIHVLPDFGRYLATFVGGASSCA